MQIVVKEYLQPKDIMFVSQSPTAKDCDEGYPISGESRKWFNRILRAISYTEDEIYITNVVKCNIPEDRLPLEKELASCFPNLLREIELVKPQIIIPLGGIAAQTILRAPLDLRITDIAGTCVKSSIDSLSDITIFPLLHPTALVFNKSRNYNAYCLHVSHLFQLLVDMKKLEPIMESWAEGFKI
jgi:DNA polymerase